MRIIRQIALLVCCFMIISCASTNKKTVSAIDSKYDGVPAKQLFASGEQSMVDNEFGRAVQFFEALDSQYPYNDYAEQMLLDLIYAYHRNDDNTSAAVTAGRYIHLYPRGKHVDYAYYMKGVANFEQKKSLFARIVPVDKSLRDPGTTLQAYNDFATFIRRYPKSRYVADARQRMIYMRNLFAKKEMHAALFYYRHKAYVAAANRASFIVQNYPQAPQSEKALLLLVKANQKLGLSKEAAQASAVLKHNYPHTQLALDTKGKFVHL